MPKARFLFLLMFLAGGMCFPLMAQERENDADTVKRETRAQREVESLATQAEARGKIEALGRVTFEDVLAAPDDVGLNYRYAQKQVEDQNFLGAAATLERILLVNPNIPPIRLFYAVVLFRLDNYQEARRELEMLLSLEISPALRKEAEEYLRRIKRRSKQWRLALTETVGWQVDSNRNASPSSKHQSFGNAWVPVTGTNKIRRDTSFLNITNVDAGYDLGFQAGHELRGSFTYFLQEQTVVDSLDLQSFQYDAGLGLKFPWFEFYPKFYASQIFLSREHFLRIHGGSFEISRNFGGKFDAVTEVKIEQQDFLPIEENAAARERKGRYAEICQMFGYRIHPRVGIFTGLVYGNKSAKEDYNAYERLQWRSGFSVILPKEVFVMNTLDLGIDDYDEPDMAIASRFRRDQTMRYRLTVGTTLETLWIGKLLPQPLKGMIATASYEYFRSHSNVTNYSYLNHKFQALLIKKWEF